MALEDQHVDKATQTHPEDFDPQPHHVRSSGRSEVLEGDSVIYNPSSSLHRHLTDSSDSESNTEENGDIENSSEWESFTDSDSNESYDFEAYENDG